MKFKGYLPYNELEKDKDRRILRKEVAMYRKTQIRDLVNTKVLPVGVDASKFFHIGVAKLPSGGFTKRSRFYNDGHGFMSFLEQINRWKNETGCEHVVVGIESTGHYWEALAYWLERRGIKVVLVNPLHTNRAKELIDNSPNKTDDKDAMVIADLVAQGKWLTCILPKGDYATLRELVVARSRLIVEQTAHINLLHSLIDRCFPEFQRVFKDIGGKTSLSLLNIAPCAQDVIALGPEGLLRALASISGIWRSRIQALFEVAKGSIALEEGLDGYRLAIRQTIRTLTLISEQVMEVEARIEETLKKIDEARYPLSIKGIGHIIVAGVLGETGGLGLYNRAEDVVKLAGLNLYEISSGEHKGKRRITKRGRPLLRHILYLAAIQQSRPGSPLYGFYRGLVSRGVNRTKALMAVGIKLMRIMFALVRDKRFFVEDEQQGSAQLRAA